MNTVTPSPDWLRALYPFTPQTHLTAAGARMSYLDEGPRTDEAVLMVHGNPTWSFYFREVVKALSPERRCIVPDHIGMGLSEKPEAYDYCLATRIADLEGLVQSLGIKRLHLIVHDWGGAIGCGFAVRHPEMIGSLVILNTAAFYSPHLPRRIALCRTGLFGKVLVRGFNGFAGPATWMSTVRPLSREVKRGFLFPYDSWAHRVAVHGFVLDIPMRRSHPTRAVLDGIEARLSLLSGCKRTILWGGRDFCFNDHFLDKWKQIYPDAAMHRYEDAGHYVLEDAGEDIRRRIREALA